MVLMRRLIALFFLLSCCVFGETVSLLPVPRMQFFDANGKPLAGGKVYTYAAGTLIPLATYTDASGETPNSNPIILDSGGFASIWIGEDPYKIIVQNSKGVVQWSQDNVTNLGISSASGGCLDLRFLGGSGNGTTDNSPAMAAALSLLGSASGCIYMPSGIWTFNTAVTVNLAAGQTISFRGDSSKGTKLYFPSSAGLIVNYHYSSAIGTSDSSVNVSDMTFAAGSQNVYDAIFLNQASTVTNGAVHYAVSNISNVAFIANVPYTSLWSRAIRIKNVSNVNIDSVNILGGQSLVNGFGTLGTGIEVEGLNASSYAFVINITNSYIGFIGTALKLDSYWQGISVSQTNFTADQFGIYVPASQLGTLAQISVVASQFNCSTYGIGMDTFVDGLAVSNSYLVVPDNGIGVKETLGGGSVVNNRFVGPGNGNGANGVVIAGGSGATISANLFSFFNTAIWLQTGSQGNAVGVNEFGANGMNVFDQGTANGLTGNLLTLARGSSSGCSTAATAGATCNTQITWNRPMPDVNYQESCTLENPSGSPYIMGVFNKTTTGLFVVIQTSQALVSTGLVSCIATEN